MKRQASDGYSSYFFASDVDRQKMTDPFPELMKQYKKSPYANKEDVAALSKLTGLTNQQIDGWFQAERHRNKVQTKSKPKRHRAELLKWFERDPFPLKEDLQELSKSTGLSHQTLKRWFVRERYKRRQAGESIIRERTFSNQYPELEKQFKIDPYSKGHHEELALKTGLSVRQVQRWFWRKRKADDKVAPKYPQLVEQFKKNPHPDQSDMSRLIEDTGLTRLQIYDWFRKKQKSSGLNGPVLSEKFKSLKENYPQIEQQFNLNPYPTEDEKEKLSEITGLQKHTLDNWFADQRMIKGATHTNPDEHHGQSLTKKFPVLDQQFKLNPNPTETEKRDLIEATGLTRIQIYRYFYRRTKLGLTSPKHNTSLSKKYPELEQQFKLNPNPTETEKLDLIKATGLTRQQINDHFRHRRQKNTQYD